MARAIQVMPLLEDYREFFDFSPDWPGEKMVLWGRETVENTGVSRTYHKISQIA